MVMKQYVKGNITNAAADSVKYITKIVSQSSEVVIYMFLGLSTVSADHYFDIPFIVAAVFFTLCFRTIGVIVQCFILNKFRTEKFKIEDQFILAYGGLKGAIAYGLVVSIPAAVSAKSMFITTTIAIIYFNVFVQGITIRPLINLLKIKTEDEKEEKQMMESVYSKYSEYMMAGIEEIAGQKGHYSSIGKFEKFNARVLKPLLMRQQKKQHIDFTSVLRFYERLILDDAIKLAQMKNLSDNRKNVFLNEFLQSGKDIEQLHILFDEFLKKLKRMDEAMEDEMRMDIQDDYMAEVQAQHDAHGERRLQGMEMKEIDRSKAKNPHDV
uniref:Na_H_Exchanger domain-containing protein n=1 Tax=Caenorhabditis tropicalis TaxID=1561998 RepID=A0A1I7T4V7_9PELO